jgi:hypothetical protein
MQTQALQKPWTNNLNYFRSTQGGGTFAINFVHKRGTSIINFDYTRRQHSPPHPSTHDRMPCEDNVNTDEVPPTAATSTRTEATPAHEAPPTVATNTYTEVTPTYEAPPTAATNTHTEATPTLDTQEHSLGT